MTDLNDAVDALTQPTRTKVIQGDDVTVVVHEPLLKQLDDRIRSTLGDAGGGSGSATGSMLDDEALYKATIIGSQIRDWCRKVGVRPARDMVADLRSWYAVHIGRIVGDEFYTRQLRSWKAQIEGMLDRPKQIPLDGACVVCGAVNYLNADGDKVLFPLLVEYRPSDPFGTAQTTCRACLVVWDGAQALSELIGEMTEKTG